MNESVVFKRLSDLIEFAEEVTADALLHAEEFLDSLHQTDSYQTDDTQEARDELSHPKEVPTPKQPTSQADHATAQRKTLEHPHQHLDPVTIGYMIPTGSKMRPWTMRTYLAQEPQWQ